MSINNSARLNVNPASACMELIPYVPAEQVLNIPRNTNQEQAAGRPVQTGSLARINPNLVQHAISYVPIDDLPAFAATCTNYQTQAVSQCFRRMQTEESEEHFMCLTRAVTNCRGRNQRFVAADIFQIQGTCKVTQLQQAECLLGDDDHNARLAQKFPGLEMLGIDGPTPNLSCFAAHCPKLESLVLWNGTLTDETLPDQDLLSLKSLTLWTCEQSDQAIDRFLARCPLIQICAICPKKLGNMYATTERIGAITSATRDGTLNALIHGSKEGKPESKKAE